MLRWSLVSRTIVSLTVQTTSAGIYWTHCFLNQGVQPAVEGRTHLFWYAPVNSQCGTDPVSKELIHVLAFKINMSKHLVISNENTIYTSFLERPLKRVRLVHSICPDTCHASVPWDLGSLSSQGVLCLMGNGTGVFLLVRPTKSPLLLQSRWDHLYSPGKKPNKPCLPCPPSPALLNASVDPSF